MKKLFLIGAVLLAVRGMAGVNGTVAANGGPQLPSIYVSSGTTVNGPTTISSSTALSGALVPQQLTSAAINAIAGPVGRVYICSNCATEPYSLCVSTGTGINQYRISGTTSGCF